MKVDDDAFSPLEVAGIAAQPGRVQRMEGEMRDFAKELRERAAERRRVGWEISDAMVPREMEEIADEIERLRAELETARARERQKERT